MGRASLPLTCDNSGTDEVQMKEKLSKWFRLKEKWGAISLIGEADVYPYYRPIWLCIRNLRQTSLRLRLLKSLSPFPIPFPLK